MSYMEWTLKLSVGISSYDREHQRLVKIINDLHAAMQVGQGAAQLGAILDGLISYAQTHFANEERAMARHKFPGFPAHKAEHEALTQQVRAIHEKFTAGATDALSAETMTFLKAWLLNHIHGTDRGYTRFLAGKDLS